MNSKKVIFGVRRMALATAIAGLLGAAGLSSTAAAQSTTNAVAAQAEQAALHAWRQSIKHMAPPTEGCFHVAYPSAIWQKVACSKARISHPVLSREIMQKFFSQKAVNDSSAETSPLVLGTGADIVGNGNGYLAQTSSLTQAAMGSFPVVTNVTSISTSGAAATIGANGSNQYTIQLNTNQVKTAACNAAPVGTASCKAWVQFAYEADGASGIFYIQNWLIGWGISSEAINLAKTLSGMGVPLTSISLLKGTSCPAGWTSSVGGCANDSFKASAPAIPISSLASVFLGGLANANYDIGLLAHGKDMYITAQLDSVADISSGWNQTEFNVYGNGGAGVGNFNSGTSITVKLQVNDGSWSAPTCLGPSGIGATGETNNLTVGQCTATGETIVPSATGFSLADPYIQFTESN